MSNFARRFGARLWSEPGAREAPAVPAAPGPARALRRRGGPHAIRTPRVAAQLGAAAPRALAGTRRRRHRPHPVRPPALPEPAPIRYAFHFIFTGRATEFSCSPAFPYLSSRLFQYLRYTTFIIRV